MKKNSENLFLYNLTRTVMTLLSCFAVYILYEVVQMRDCPDYALRYFGSFPQMIENVLGTLSLYCATVLVFIKINRG